MNDRGTLAEYREMLRNRTINLLDAILKDDWVEEMYDEYCTVEYGTKQIVVALQDEV